MELSQIVTPLEISKKLKELGVKQESLMVWLGGEIRHPRQDDIYEKDTFSAFTASELASLLPAALEKTSTWLTITRQWGEGGLWVVRYNPDDGEPNANYYEAPRCETLVEAVAEMLIYLIEEGIITPSSGLTEND